MDDDRKILTEMSMYASAIAELRRLNDPGLESVIRRLVERAESLGEPLLRKRELDDPRAALLRLHEERLERKWRNPDRHRYVEL